jgi:capsular exopolysaccharide synthesis family protein
MTDYNNGYPVKANGREVREWDEHYPSDPYYNNNGYDDNDDINVKEYLDILLRRKWLILACLIIAVVIATIKTFTTVPLYRASATIEIKPDIPKITSFQDLVQAERTNTYDYYQTQFSLIRSKTLGILVLENLRTKDNKDTKKTISKAEGKLSGLIESFKSLISKGESANSIPKKHNKLNSNKKISDSEVYSFISGISVGPIGNTRLASVSYVSSDPVYASLASDTIVDVYIEWILQRRLGTSKSAREFLQTQLDQLKVKIEQTEEELSSFAKNVDIISLDKDIDLNYKQLVEITDALSQIETEKFKKQAIIKDVREGNYAYLPEVISNPRVQELSSTYAELRAEYDNLSAIYGPNFPDIQKVKSQMNSVQGQLKSTLTKIAESIKRDYETTVKKEEILIVKAEEKKKRSAELNEKAIQYRILEREVETNKSIYDDLLQKLKETEVTSAIRETNVQVVDYSTVPKSPFKPNIKTNVLYSIMVGLMLGCFISFGIEFFSTKLRDEEEIKKKFSHVPYLGAIPLAEEADVNKLEKIVYTNPRSVVSEAFRVIRTSILYSSADHPPRSLLVTSPQPIEGKTTSASNLALSMIQSNLNVVLIDGDLRKPRLHKLYSSNGNNMGLSTYLVGKGNVDNIISHTDITGLDFISSGPIPPNPAELLGSKKMKELIENLTEKYEHVIIDGAPIAAFADSRLLSRLVDGVLLVTSVGITQKNVLKTSIEEIRKVRGKIIGTIVNRLDSRRDKYKYKYYYYYSDEKRIDSKEKRSISSHSN